MKLTLSHLIAFTLALLSISLQVLASPSAVQARGEETNAQRLARGLPPNKPRNLGRSPASSEMGAEGKWWPVPSGGGHHCPKHSDSFCCNSFTYSDSYWGKWALKQHGIHDVPKHTLIGLSCKKSGWCSLWEKKGCCEESKRGLGLYCQYGKGW